MRILLVHARRLDELGGAEISLSMHVAAAPAGVTVDTALPEESCELDRYDAVILANLRPTAGAGGAGGPVKQWVWHALDKSAFQAVTLRRELAAARDWLRRLEKYRGRVIRSERDVHPCAYRTGACVAVEPVRREPCGCSDRPARVFEELYNRCDVVQFLSPLHREAVNALVRIRVPQAEIAPPLDFARFRRVTPWAERRPRALLTGDAIRVADTAEERARAAGFAVERREYLATPYAEMPALLNGYQAVVLDPVMLHAFGRLAAEALACGCRVIASGRVGALSWPDPLAACREANARFWEMVLGTAPELRQEAEA